MMTTMMTTMRQQQLVFLMIRFVQEVPSVAINSNAFIILVLVGNRQEVYETSQIASSYLFVLCVLCGIVV